MTKAEIREQQEEQAFRDLQCIIYQRSGEYRQKESRRKELQGKINDAVVQMKQWQISSNICAGLAGMQVGILCFHAVLNNRISWVNMFLLVVTCCIILYLQSKRRCLGRLVKQYQRELEAIQ